MSASFNEPHLSFNFPQSMNTWGNMGNVADYPVINLALDSHKRVSPQLSASAAFLNRDFEIDENHILTAWKTGGVKGLISALSELEGGKALNAIGAFFRFTNSVIGQYEQMLKKTNQLAAENRNINYSVQALAWHPHITKLALATLGDTVLIYGNKPKDSSFGSVTPVILRHPLQKNIFCLSWRPRSSGYLAIGCEGGTVIWSLDPSSLGTRPTSSCLTLLSHEDQPAATTISWHPEGKHLCTGSSSSSTILVWNIEAGEAVPLRKFGGQGTKLVSWSPSGDRLFAATGSTLFRVWDTRRWNSETWNTAGGTVSAAAWSPDGRHLIFVDNMQPIIYGLTFDPLPALGEQYVPLTDQHSSQKARAVADLSGINFTDSEETTKISSQVRSLVWDPKGERLAVVFEDSNIIAVFRTIFSPALSLVPCEFVRGPAGTIPTACSFESQFKNGALLSVAWSSGSVEHVPLVFSSEIPHYL